MCAERGVICGFSLRCVPRWNFISGRIRERIFASLRFVELDSNSYYDATFSRFEFRIDLIKGMYNK